MGAPEYLEAGCCITNECVKEYTKECPCSEDIRKINESILDISATIKSYQASQYKPSLCEDKKDPAPHCRELQAQLKMAKWAMIAGLTAIGALGALIVTLILQALANWSLANQNKVAQDSVDVAKDTLEQARIASRRELRAYLGIVEIKSKAMMVPQGMMRPIPLERPAENPISIVITFQNVGQTPANNIFIQANHVMGTAETRGELPEPEIRTPMGSMMPTSTHHMATEISNDEEWLITQSLIMDEEARIIVYGTITYDDIYGSSHETTFNAFLEGQIDGATFTIGHGDNNYMT